MRARLVMRPRTVMRARRSMNLGEKSVRDVKIVDGRSISAGDQLIDVTRMHLVLISRRKEFKLK